MPAAFSCGRLFNFSRQQEVADLEATHLRNTAWHRCTPRADHNRVAFDVVADVEILASDAYCPGKVEAAFFQAKCIFFTAGSNVYRIEAVVRAAYRCDFAAN